MALRLGGFLLPGASFTVFQDPCHSPLSVFCRQPADRISDHKRTTSPFSPGDQQLLARHSGIYPAFYHHLRRDPPCHRPFLLYEIPVPGHAAYHAEKSRDLWRLCHWPDPYGVLHARRVYVRQDPVVIEKSSSLPGLKIALIADLHLGYNSTKSHVRKIVDTINSQNVDLVCIAGDLFDNDYNAIKDPDEVADILSGIKSRYGTYACWGNHDVSEKILAGFTFPQKETIVRDGRFTEFLHHAGITMLEDETVCIDNAFYLVGRRDKDMAKKEQLLRKTFAEITEPLDPSLPIIVMDHQPGELSEASDAGVDLDLSGHTHDGQMFPANLVVHFLWENACGVLKKGSMTSIVTSGAGVWGPAMRVGTNNEVVIANVSFDPATDQ